MGKYFGTDGFRGEANVDLTVEHAYKVGRFLGSYYSKDELLKAYEIFKKNQYGKYLKDVYDGKYIDHIHQA